ncbi:hypothetical protein DFQ27_004174 [Actinomortierella ambigua]|uniref:MICOS complex subunit MIC19 n=1 Tax=Actinomortierella ambigua TaxID=1343610 RepID=A0A9P6Q3S4_9FUNG|nr:hypothetical protein DFQ27_004174 [Actinomortierella ambigua]
MGASQSRQEPMVFMNEDDPVQVRISSNFVNQLAQAQPSAGSPQDVENQVRQRVQAELERIKLQENEFANYKSTTNANANVTAQDIEHLSKQQPQKHIKALPEEIVKAQDALVACYKKNSQRSLDCWAEVEEFKTVVQKAQNAFIATA